MNGVKPGIGTVFLALALILALGSPTFAQGSIFTTLSGTVVDAEGLAIPGANVKIKNNATGQEIDLVSGGDGGFTAPNINSGNYSVIVELAGFRTTTLSSVPARSVLSEMKSVPGPPRNLRPFRAITT